MPSTRWRIAISSAIGVASGLFCWFLMKHFHQDAADLRWAIHAAQRLVAGQNPYDTPYEQYPLTAAIFALPLIHLPPQIAAGIFWGISSALLAFGVTRHSYTRLLIFLAFPYWAGILTVQWSPVIAASAFFPLLLPVTMAKPQLGLPVFLTHLSRRGVAACAAFGLLSLVWMPKWPILWLGQLGNYQHFFPLSILPGPLLFLAWLRWRDRDAIFLFLSACMPQRWFFDCFVLWLIPKSRREILVVTLCSWGVGIWRWYHYPRTMHQIGLWSILGFYLPMLAIILLRPHPVPENPGS